MTVLGFGPIYFDEVTIAFGIMAIICCAVIIGAQIFGRNEND